VQGVGTDEKIADDVLPTAQLRTTLGALHFALDATAVDSGDPDALDDLSDEGESRCTARFSAVTKARPGDRIEVNVMTAKMYFFDKRTHLAIRE